MKIIERIFNKKNIKWFALLLLLIIIILFFLLRKEVDEVSIENHDLYQYLSGVKVEYTGKIKINKDKNKIIKLSFKDINIDLDTTPIYYKGSKKVLFPKNMAVIYPILGEQYKINYYSTIYNDSDFIYVRDGSLKKNLVNSFIYDGDDIYFFIDSVTVSFGDWNHKVPPLSYIVADTLNNALYIYDRENDLYSSFSDVNSDVIISTNDYKVNASLDYMYYNNKTRLLIKDVDKLVNLSK